MDNAAVSTAAVNIKDSGGLDGILRLESSKGDYFSTFGSGLGGNVEIRSALKASMLSLQDMGGKLVIGTTSSYLTFQNTIGGNLCCKNDHLILGAATIDGNLLVMGVILSSSDSRIKEDVQPLNQDLCVEIIKSVEPNSYKRTDKANETQRDIGFIAQDIQAKLSDDMPNLVREVDDDTFGSIYAVDYGRLTTLLWGVCKNNK